MLIIKYLLKNQDLIGQTSLTSFAAIILVVFFLQNIDNPLLPSVSSLQNSAYYKLIINGWNAAFSEPSNLSSGSQNKLSVTELLFGFFEFYSVFEFGFYVISSFSGKSYLKTIFSDEKLLPDEFELYKTNVANDSSLKFDCDKYMCVQGPFNLGNNITRNTTQKSLVKFQNYCMDITAFGKRLLNEGNEVQFLVKLFDSKVKEPGEKKIKLENFIALVGVDLNFSENRSTEEDLRREWINYIFNALRDILRKVFKCEISETDNEGNKVILCEMPYHELFTKLRFEARFEFEFPKNISPLEQEEMISNYLCDTVLKNNTKLGVKFELHCSFKSNPTFINIDFKSRETNSGRNNLAYQAFQFLQINFFKWVKKGL